MNHDWAPQTPPCRTNPHLFFPENKAHPDIALAARAICQACPARQACDDYATRNNEPGIWGGRTEQDRRKGTPFRPPRVHTCPICRREFLSDLSYRATCDSDICRETKRRRYSQPVKPEPAPALPKRQLRKKVS